MSVFGRGRSSPFRFLGCRLCELVCRWKVCRRYVDRLGDELTFLYPHGNRETLVREYLSDKLAQTALVLTVGLVLLLLAMFQGNEGVFRLPRPDYWGGDEYHSLVVQADGKERTVDVAVSHREMDEEQLRTFMEEKARELPELIRGENPSLDAVSRPLKLVGEIPGTDVNVFWELEENQVLDYEGRVLSERVPEEGTLVSLKATLSYDEVRIETYIPVQVVRPSEEEEDVFFRLERELASLDSETVSQESLVLPREVGGSEVTYRQEGEDVTWILLGALTISLPLVFFAGDEKLLKRKAQRQAQMMADYPDVVNKLVLYLGAGLSLQGAFELLAQNYLSERRNRTIGERYAYEEIVFLCRGIKGGMSLREGMELFSQRCGLQPYRKLSMLLLQNLKKGSRELIGLLRQEGVNAFELRKSLARKLGEEAGTKLLFPMLLSLGMVLVILMVPAFLSFGL